MSATERSLAAPAPAALARPGLAVAALTILALGLRLFRLDQRDYWPDEVISTLASRPSLGSILSSVGDYSVHPPLYYMLLHGWALLFGEGLIGLRLLSVLISAACVPLTYLLGRRLADERVGLIAAALMTVAPFQIFHAQQASMYSLLTLVVLLAALAMLAAWERGGAGRWALFGLCVAAGLYTHIYFAFSLLALNLWALLATLREGRIERGRWAGLLLAQAVACLAFLPFLPQLMGTVGGVVQWYWIRRSSLLDAAMLPVLISLGVSYEMFRGAMPIWLILAAVIPFALLFGLAQVHAGRALRGPGVRMALPLLLLWAPPLAAAAISVALKPILIDRSLVAVIPPAYLLIAWALSRLGRRAALGLGLACAAGMLAALAYTYPAAPQPNEARALAAAVAARQQPGDAVAFADWQTFDTAYLTEPGLRDVYVLPAPAQSRVQFVSAEEWRARLGYIGWPHLDQIQPLPDFAPRYQRVWLVLSTANPALDYQLEVSKGWLDANGRLLEQIGDNDEAAWLYELP